MVSFSFTSEENFPFLSKMNMENNKRILNKLSKMKYFAGTVYWLYLFFRALCLNTERIDLVFIPFEEVAI